jgi:hypothetical protein
MVYLVVLSPRDSLCAAGHSRQTRQLFLTCRHDEAAAVSFRFYERSPVFFVL